MIFSTSFRGKALWTCLAIVGASHSMLFAQEQEIAATVNGQPISFSSVKHEVDSTIGKTKLSEQRRKQIEMVALEKMINQHVVLDFLKSRKIAADKSEVRVKVELLKAEFAKVERTIEDQLAKTGQTMADLEFQLAWQISWKRYLDGKFSDEFLEKHFHQNRRSFDGTELRVAHILLQRPKDADDSDVAAMKKKAADIKQEIQSGGSTWKTAAEKYSDAPTKDAAGELGWIQTKGPMPRTFTTAAFQLKAGQISEPVTTRFGVHLIKCIEVKDGKLGWRDALDSVKRDATMTLFNAIVGQHRPNLKIEYFDRAK